MTRHHRSHDEKGAKADEQNRLAPSIDRPFHRTNHAKPNEDEGRSRGLHRKRREEVIPIASRLELPEQVNRIILDDVLIHTAHILEVEPGRDREEIRSFDYNQRDDPYDRQALDRRPSQTHEGEDCKHDGQNAGGKLRRHCSAERESNCKIRLP